MLGSPQSPWGTPLGHLLVLTVLQVLQPHLRKCGRAREGDIPQPQGALQHQLIICWSLPHWDMDRAIPVLQTLLCLGVPRTLPRPSPWLPMAASTYSPKGLANSCLTPGGQPVGPVSPPMSRVAWTVGLQKSDLLSHPGPTATHLGDNFPLAPGPHFCFGAPTAPAPCQMPVRPLGIGQSPARATGSLRKQLWAV